jgi:hypothetical protein
MSTQPLKPNDPGFWPAIREKLNNAPPQEKPAENDKKDKK